MTPTRSRAALALPLALALFGVPAHAAKPSKTVSKAPSRAPVSPKLPHIAMKEFDLHDVKLLPGPFQTARDLNLRYLLSLSADRFLHNFLLNAGLEPKAPIYQGWESSGVAGHTLGHYLSALAMQTRGTGDERCHERLNYIVAELARCQAKIGTGYVAGIPQGDRIWREIESGDVRASGFDLNGGWVPWYTLHKLFAGLYDAYHYGGNTQAKTVLIGLSDWAVHVTRNLNESQWQDMLKCEHGGMNEVLADVYTITGDKKYLELARKFDHKAVLDPLRAQEDRLVGLHGNTQIPKVIGLARLYELTNEHSDRVAALFFWERMAKARSYAIGGNSEHEHLSEAGHLADHLGTTTAESCNTYNMLKLTLHLAEWTGDATYFDFYERALYNHILASQDPDRGMYTYFVSLKPGHFKTYSTPEDSFWCCVGTGMENHTKYNEAIYTHDANALYVNLFIASEVTWHAKALRVRQDTHFPDLGVTTLHISTPDPMRATLKVRVPSWSAHTIFKLNGEAYTIAAHPGSYATFDRTWEQGDELEAHFEMKLHTEPTPDDSTKVALLNGPIVLAAQLGHDGVPNQWTTDQSKLFGVPTPPVPVLVSQDDLTKHIAPVTGHKQTFQIQDIAHVPGQDAPTSVTLRPFYETPFDRYTVYFDSFTPTSWAQKQAEYRAEAERIRDLAARTVDEYRPGEQQSEVDHAMHGESTRTGNANGHSWRDASAGGWFEFNMKVEPNVPQALILTYWGSDSGRDFDILVNGNQVGNESLSGEKPNTLLDRSYELTGQMLTGNHVTVRVQAKPGSVAGGIFGARIVRRSHP